MFTLSKVRTIKLSLWYQESVCNGCKESQFYSLPFGQAVASMHVLTQNLFHLAPKTFWWAGLITQFLCNLNSSKNFTYPSGKLRTEFSSPIVKSTSPKLSDTTFFACCHNSIIAGVISSKTPIVFAWDPDFVRNSERPQ